MPGCAVYGCNNYSRKTKGTSIKYYSFPKNDQLCKLWKAACKRKDEINLKTACVCSDHFEPSCFVTLLKHQLINYNPKSFRNLKNDAIPTKNLKCCHKSSASDSSRAVRYQTRIRKEIVQALLNESFCKDSNSGQGNNAVNNSKALNEVESTSVNNTEQELKALMKKYNDLQVAHLLLKKRIEEYEKEKEVLTEEVSRLRKLCPDNLMKSMIKIFTPGQVQRLMGKDCRWSAADITSAISLKCVSLKAYRYLRKNKFPLPALSTLRQ